MLTPSSTPRAERGSALVLAIFVLALVTSMGVALVFLSRTETSLASADVQGKALFYSAEAGVEHARTVLFEMNKHSADPTDLSEELDALSVDGTIDFDIASVTPVFDSDGAITGFSGYNDDVAVQASTPFGSGAYEVFVNNDGVDGFFSTTDTNDRVIVTSLATGPSGTMETVQAILHRPDTFSDLPATITLLGPAPVFGGGKSNAKLYTGDDGGSHCPGGTGASVPVIGVIGAAAKTVVHAGVVKKGTYVSGSDTGDDTVADLTLDPSMDPMWTDCDLLLDLAEIIKFEADVVGNSSTPLSALGTPGDPKIVFIDDDYDVPGGGHYAGVLWVTGHLNFSGNAAFDGVIFIVGQGDFLRDGSGNGDIAGGLVVANISGPDGDLFTADDCAGLDGINGTPDDGVAQSSYYVNGNGVSITGYCSSNIFPWQGLRPMEVVGFLQR